MTRGAVRTADGAAAERAPPVLGGGAPPGEPAGVPAVVPDGEPAGEAAPCRVATEPIEAEVPLITPFKPDGKKPPMPVELARVAMLITCNSFQRRTSERRT